MSNFRVTPEADRVFRLLDSGRYAAARQAITALTPDDPVLSLVIAELALGFDRFEEAHDALDSWRGPALDARLRYRVLMVQGGLTPREGQGEAAERMFGEAALVARDSLGEGVAEARALVELAHVRSDLGLDVGDLLDRARELVSVDDGAAGRFVAGLVAYEDGRAALASGDRERAIKLLNTAVDSLRGPEPGRHYAAALRELSAVERDGGASPLTLPRLREARDILLDLDVEADLGMVLVDMGTLALEAGRFDEAASTADEALGYLGRAHGGEAAVAALSLGAAARLEQNDFEAAERLIMGALEASNTPAMRPPVRLLHGRLLALQGRTGEAGEVFRIAADEAREAGDRQTESHALAFLLETLEESKPRPTGQLGRVLRAVREKPAPPIRRTPRNELVVNGEHLPTWTVAKRTLERFMLENALKQTDNNQAAAGRLLKITKVAVHHACRRHRFLPK